MRTCGAHKTRIGLPALIVCIGVGTAGAQGLGHAPLTAEPGDPARGRAVVTDRRVGLCLLCHSGPFPEERFQGDLAPSLAGAGARNTVAELRQRMIDSRTVMPTSIMPAFYSAEGLTRVGPQFSGKTILTAQQIEDVVAFLLTLREPP